MAANYEAVKSEAEHYAHQARQKLPIDKVFLFGSYTKGTADDLSDVDIAFFIKDFNGKIRHEIGMELLKLTHSYKSYFEPLVFPSSKIARGNPFISEILRTGQEINVSANTINKGAFICKQ